MLHGEILINENTRKIYRNNIIHGRFLNMHITADKREIKDFPKLLLATSFIHKMFSEIGQKR